MTLNLTSGDPLRADDPAPALAVRSVTKHWPRLAAPVLDAVDLELPRGCAAWIGGANGAGKTTLLRIVAGLVEPEGGSVLVDGIAPEPKRRDYQSRIAYLPAASVGLYARLTVAQHLAYWARVTFTPPRERRAAIDRALGAFGLEALRDARVDRISMGQRQRVRLAMTFLPPAPLVLLDEPRNSLDDEGGARLADQVLARVEDGGTVVWCSPSGEPTGVEMQRRYVVEAGRLESPERTAA